MRAKANNKFITILYIVYLMFLSGYFIYTRVSLELYRLIEWVLVVLIMICVQRYFFWKRGSWFIRSVFIFSSYMFFYFLLDGGKHTTYMKDMLVCLLSVVPAFVLSQDKKQLSYFYIFACLISLFIYYLIRQDHFILDENSYGGGSIIGCLLPMTFLVLKDKKESLKIIVSLALLLGVITSAKRGDILVAIMTFASYYYFHYKNNKKIKFKHLLLLSLFLIAFAYIVSAYIESSIILQNRIESTLSGDSSARDVIYNSILNYYSNSTFYQKFFGNGFNASTQIAGFRAHSDWLEILIDEGILGCILYFSLLISFYGEARKVRDVEDRGIMYSILVAWFLESIFSMFVFDGNYCMYFIVAGYIFHKNQQREFVE